MRYQLGIWHNNLLLRCLLRCWNKNLLWLSLLLHSLLRLRLCVMVVVVMLLLLLLLLLLLHLQQKLLLF